MGRVSVIRIENDNFNIRQICDSGQCFRMKELQDGSYEVISRDRYLRLRQEGRKISFYCSREEWEEIWFDYFDLGTNYQAFISRINPRDSYLLNAAGQAEGVRILKQDLWEMIVSFLISQQNNIKRIRHCIELLCEKYGDPCLTEEGVRYFSFPGPERFVGIPQDELMSCNLGYRSKYVVLTAQAVADGQVDLEKIASYPHWRAKKELLRCFGVGEKVAECICLFALHHLDAFPVDTHIRQALDRHYKRGFPHRRYKDCQGVLQQYIFYHELVGKKDK